MTCYRSISTILTWCIHILISPFHNQTNRKYTYSSSSSAIKKLSTLTNKRKTPIAEKCHESPFLRLTVKIDRPIVLTISLVNLREVIMITDTIPTNTHKRRFKNILSITLQSPLFNRNGVREDKSIAFSCHLNVNGS